MHIDAGREWRGGQRQVLLLARGQRARGMEPLVVAQPDSPLVRRARSAGLAASAVRMRADWDLAAVRRIRMQVRAWRPDLVHAHDARAHAMALAALTGQRQIPLIVTRRVPFVPRGRLKYGSLVTRFIAISEAVRAAMLAGHVRDDRIDVVYSGVPAPSVSAPRDWRTEAGWESTSVLCGVVGAMTREKGVGLLDRIAEGLDAESEERCRVVLLGGHGGGATSVGHLPAFRAGFVDEIHAAMASLDVLWHPSSAEGLGTSVIDAMALGVPPIAFAVGGLTELIEDGVSGLLVPPGDVAAFAAAASRLAHDRDLRAHLADAGRLRAQRFGVDQMVDGTTGVYRKVLGTPG